MQVPSARIDHTTDQEQVVVRRHHDELLAVDGEGEVTEVRRRFVESWEGVREPGAQALERSMSPLHERTITVALDEEGERVAHPPRGVRIPKAVLAEERFNERFEAVLPDEPVAVGASWTVTDERLQQALPMAKDGSEGQIRCTLTAIREEAIDEDSPPDRYAIVTIKLDVTSKQGDAEDDPTLSFSMQGDLRVSLARRKIVSVDLLGTGRLQQTRREGETVATVDGKGPVEIHKRMWFPDAEAEAKRAAELRAAPRGE